MTAVAPVTARPVAALATRLVARGAGVVLAVAAGMPAAIAMLGVAAAFALVGTWSHSRRDIG